MKKILVVDDYEAILEAVVEYLECQFPGYTILACSNSDAAITLIWNLDETFDLVICDYELDPENKRGGDRVTYEAKSRSRRTRVLICSGALSTKYQEITACCADFYLQKPYQINEFLSVVKRLLGIPIASVHESVAA